VTPWTALGSVTVPLDMLLADGQLVAPRRNRRARVRGLPAHVTKDFKMLRVPVVRLAAGICPLRWGTAGFARGGGHDTLGSDGKRTCGDATDCGAGRGPPHPSCRPVGC
jgi:hypothetical protein